MNSYQPLDSSPKLGQIQQDMLKSWKAENVFERSVHNGQAEEVVFYDSSRI